MQTHDDDTVWPAGWIRFNVLATSQSLAIEVKGQDGIADIFWPVAHGFGADHGAEIFGKRVTSCQGETGINPELDRWMAIA